MITKNLDKYKVSTTEQTITSYAGLPLLMGMARSLGLEGKLNGLKLKERERGYKPAEMIWTMMGLLQAGGVALDDVSLLRGDEGLVELLGELPAANTLGDFLRRFGNRTLYELGEIELETAVKVIRACGLKRVTLDVDAFFLESQKSDAMMNYEGMWGYNPVAVSCGELKMPMAGLFRPGNASPMANLAGLLRRVIEALKRHGIEVRVRSDSAGYQAGVVRECHEAGVDFTITARKDAAVMLSIRSIPQGDWQSLESTAWENRQTSMAETVHAFGAEDLPAYRLIVIRWPKEQRELFDKDPYSMTLPFLGFSPRSFGLSTEFKRLLCGVVGV